MNPVVGTAANVAPSLNVVSLEVRPAGTAIQVAVSWNGATRIRTVFVPTGGASLAIDGAPVPGPSAAALALAAALDQVPAKAGAALADAAFQALLMAP